MLQRNERYYAGETPNGIAKLKDALSQADCVIIGAGAGLSTSAGFIYNGEKFTKYFGDFQEKYQIQDMYSGGFYPFSSLEENWAWWSRAIYVNRYEKAPKPVYEQLLALVKDKDYFVITTNVDHQFQKAGFDKARLFYTQGDYGLWQCSRPCHQKTYDNKSGVVKMLLDQGFGFDTDGCLTPPSEEEGGRTHTDFKKIRMHVSSDLVPYCPVCGEPMTMNLRCDDTFVEDEGWHIASHRYTDYIRSHQNKKVLFLDLGCGQGTPVIFKIPFMQWTRDWPDATYACINKGEAYAAESIWEKSILIDGDIGEVLGRIESKD